MLSMDDQVNYLKKYYHWENTNDLIDTFIVELSEVDSDIIQRLIDNIVAGISDKFFISFESLFHIGKKAKFQMKTKYHKLDPSDNFIRKIFELLLHYYETDELLDPIILRLYHPDFVLRAKALMELESGCEKIDKVYILPLLDDPDDSVRWSAIKYLIHFLSDAGIKEALSNHLTNEKNEIIKDKLEFLLS